MHYVSLLVEFLRGRPAVVFWTAALTQAALWTLIPAIFYGAPPGDVPLLLAIGREFVLGSYLGPPLAFWLGEIAFRIAGSFGLYTLAQACIVLTYWAVFVLGRSIVGTRHAILAILLMVGITAFAVPSPNFGPAVLAAPLWALGLLFYWRAVGEGRRGYWFLLALDLGLLLLANYVGVILLVLMIIFTAASVRGRNAAQKPEPWIAVLLLCIVVFPHVIWFRSGRSLIMEGIDESFTATGRLSPGLWLIFALVLTHLGSRIIGRTDKWMASPSSRARTGDRSQPRRSVRSHFCVHFRVGAGSDGGHGCFCERQTWAAWQCCASCGAFGTRGYRRCWRQDFLYRERLVSAAWLGLLVVPPVLVAVSIAIFPWTLGSDLKIAQPANAEGRFYADIFQRRTGKPLAYLSGDPRVAPLVALAAPSRPHLYFAWAPERSPWVTLADMHAQGGILVWPAADNSGTAPATLKVQFPEMVPEVPRSFPRAVQGMLPLIRIGWSMQRPQ